MKLIGVDVGGTFTDVVYTDTDTHQVLIHKVPTTPADPSVGVITGITDLCTRNGINLTDIQQIYHGTTIATNALLEYKGARAGVVTTKGYRDILHIGRHQRPQHYSIQQEIPWQDRPLARRRHRKLVTARLIPPKGDVLLPLVEQRLRRTGRQADLHIMRSNGGVATPAMVAEKRVHTRLSGAGAGVLGGAWSGAQSQRPLLITVEMGGTSADIGVVTNGSF